jgi:hypothetical protein
MTGKRGLWRVRSSLSRGGMEPSPASCRVMWDAPKS